MFFCNRTMMCAEHAQQSFATTRSTRTLSQALAPEHALSQGPGTFCVIIYAAVFRHIEMHAKENACAD